MRRSEFYSQQDVEDACWILETNNSLNHGIVFEVWAAKVLAWYYNFINLVEERIVKAKAWNLSTSLQDVLTQTTNLIKNGVLFVYPVMLMN